MSLEPKIAEVTEFNLRDDIDLESWQKEQAADRVVEVPG